MSNTQSLLTILDLPLNDRLSTPVLVKVQPGQTVSQLLTDFYGVPYDSKVYKLALAQLMRHNSWVVNPNRIQVGQILKLMPLPKPQAIAQVQFPATFDPIEFGRTQGLGMCYACEPAVPNYDKRMTHYIPNNPREFDAFQSLAWFYDSWPAASTSIGMGLNSLGMITGERNSVLILQVKSAYQRLQAGEISRNQYNYIRQSSLKVLKSKLGPLEKILFKGKTANEAVRIVRTKGIPATEAVVNEAAHFGRLAKLATKGNVVLGIVGVGMTCWDIHSVDDHRKQNEVFVESLGSTFGGAVASTLALMLVTGPIGVVAALVITTSVVGASWGAGKAAQKYYSRMGHDLDLVGHLGVRSLCHR